MIHYLRGSSLHAVYIQRVGKIVCAISYERILAIVSVVTVFAASGIKAAVRISCNGEYFFDNNISMKNGISLVRCVNNIGISVEMKKILQGMHTGVSA